MRGPHPDIGPELRALAQAILDRLDPAVRTAAAMASAAGGGPGKCQQVWCPVCALAALATGEQHPLLTLIAEHSVALMTMIRAMATDVASSPADQGSEAPDPSDGGGPDGGGPGGGKAQSGKNQGRYQRIPVTVEDVPVTVED